MFKTPTPASGGSVSPEELFRDLPRRPDGPKHLWAHQADMLRSYVEPRHLNAADLAIELPTGAGKTLVGTLIGEWRRRTFGERVVFLSPTIQLARQVLGDAHAAGIDVVDLTGKHRQWPADVEQRYRRGEAIAVAHYGSVFNAFPKLADADLLIFDDAHAAAGSIASNWTVRFRTGDPAVQANGRDFVNGYDAVLELLGDGLPGGAARRFIDRAVDPRDRQAAFLVAPQIQAARLDELAVVIDEHAEASRAGFAWSMIRDNLDVCSVFVAADELIVRPLIPPTSTHQAYTDPKQRLYLSATLGAGGELERAFGRPTITRVPVPQGWDERGTGRRFFVFPELTRDFATAADSAAVKTAMNQWLSDLMRDTGRSLLLAPSTWAMNAAFTEIGPPVVRLGKDDIAGGLDAFTSEPSAVLALANRYDGIDLPDEDCRLIVMADLPVGADPQERFYATTLGARRVLQERTRTRFAQGSGRATRNTNDRAVVVVLGRRLISFVSDPDTQAETHPEICAELELGILNSRGVDASELRAMIDAFLARAPEWATTVEPSLRALRDQAAARTSDPDTDALSASAKYEVRAVDAAWRGDFCTAVDNVSRVLASLTGGAELRPYQALWNYIGEQWARRAGDADPAYHAQADDMARAAQAAASRTTWMPNRQGSFDRALSAAPALATSAVLSAVDEVAARGVVAYARELGTPRQLAQALNMTVERLSQRSAGEYEQGLVGLGRLLGADAHKPMGEARADALWRWGTDQWIAWEAKSGAEEDGETSARTVRQANTHLKGAAEDLQEEIPPTSATIIASPQSGIDPSAKPLANNDVCFANLDDVLALAEETVDMWRDLQGRLLSDAPETDLVNSVLEAMFRRGLAASGVVQRLGGQLF